MWPASYPLDFLLLALVGHFFFCSLEIQPEIQGRFVRSEKVSFAEGIAHRRGSALAKQMEGNTRCFYAITDFIHSEGCSGIGGKEAQLNRSRVTTNK